MARSDNTKSDSVTSIQHMCTGKVSPETNTSDAH